MITSPRLRKDDRKISPPHLLHGVRCWVFGFLPGRGLDAALGAPFFVAAGFTAAALPPSDVFTEADLAAAAPPAVVPPDGTPPASPLSVLFDVIPLEFPA